MRRGPGWMRETWNYHQASITVKIFTGKILHWMPKPAGKSLRRITVVFTYPLPIRCLFITNGKMVTWPWRHQEDPTSPRWSSSVMRHIDSMSPWPDMLNRGEPSSTSASKRAQVQSQEKTSDKPKPEDTHRQMTSTLSLFFKLNSLAVACRLSCPVTCGILVPWCFPGGSDGKESVYNAGDLDLIPGLGRSSGEGSGNTLQYSCLGNPMDRGAWQATVRGAAKSLTQRDQTHKPCITKQILNLDHQQSPWPVLLIKVSKSWKTEDEQLLRLEMWHLHGKWNPGVGLGPEKGR